jgi:hypothetical protein
MMAPAALPLPRTIVASNQAFIPLGTDCAEPGVDVLVNTLEPAPIFGGSMARATIATHHAIPATNDGSS